MRVRCTFSVRPAQHQSLKTEKRRVQGGSSDPEHRTAAGTFWAIEEGGAEFILGKPVSRVGALFAGDMAVVSVGCTASLGHWRIIWRGRWSGGAGLRDTDVMLSLRLSFTRLETRAQEFLTKCE